jgi:hypothetical protein
MGFIAGFAETVVDQYNKNAERQDAEKQMTLKYRLDALQKKRDEWDAQQKADKELMDSATWAAGQIPGADPADVADIMKRAKINDPKEVLQLYSDGQLSLNSKPGAITVEVPNADLKKPEGMPEAVTNPTGVTPNAPEQTAQTTPVAGVVQDTKKVNTGKYRQERTPDPIDTRKPDELDQVDQYARKIAPNLFDYDKQEEVKKATEGTGFTWKPKMKEVKLDSVEDIFKRINDAKAAKDPAALKSAEADLATYSEAATFKFMQENNLKKSVENPYEVADPKELYYERDRLAAAGKDTKDVEMRIAAAEKEEKLKGDATKPRQFNTFAIRRADGTYAGQFPGFMNDDGTIRNARTGKDVPMEQAILIDEKQGQRISESRIKFAEKAKDYNEKLAAISSTVQASAKLVYLVDNNWIAGTTTGSVVATFKDVLSEGAAAVSIFGEESDQVRETMAYFEGIDPNKPLSKQDLSTMQARGSYLINQFLSKDINQLASDARLIQALKSSIVFTLAAANGEDGKSLSNMDMSRYEKMVSGRGEDIANKIAEAVGGQKAALMTTERELNGPNNPLRAMEEEFGGDLKFDGSKVTRFDEAAYMGIKDNPALLKIAKRITGGNPDIYNRNAPAQEQPQQPKPAKEVGGIYTGRGGKQYKYLGGDPKDPKSYEEVK